jgi:homoserine O-succinyltransferase/O-acetyltransferase
MPSGRLRVGVIDMNAGHQNQAIRCIGVLIDQLESRVRLANPGLEIERVHVSPRDKGDVPPNDCHLYISSGGPGSPYDGDGQTWVDDYSEFLDGVVDDNEAHNGRGRAVLAVCYSFEMAVRHFDVAEVAPRASRKFGVMPVYTTDDGQQHPLLAPFGDRLFAFEHRNWEAVRLDEGVLKKFGGRLLARESRDGVSKGEALMAFDFAPGIEGVQFHPEADRPGVMAWVARPDQAEAFKLAYGITTYERMLKTLDNPQRLARTFALLIPGWMTRKFNAIAERHGWNPLPPPVQDMATFGSIHPPPPSAMLDDGLDDAHGEKV